MQLTFQDVFELRSRAVRAYCEVALNDAPQGTNQRPWTDDDRRAVAWLVASLEVLSRKGALTPEGAAMVVGMRQDFSSAWEER